VPPTRSRLSGPSLEALRARATRELGPGARIVSAQKVTVGGLAGFFARQHYEVVVEVPDAPVARVTITPRDRVGIAALLADADEAEAELQRRDLPDLDDTRRAARRGWSATWEGADEPVGGPVELSDPAVAGAPADERGASDAARSLPGGPASAGTAAGSSVPGGRRAARATTAGPARDDAFATLMDDLAFNGLVTGRPAAPATTSGTAGPEAPRTPAPHPAPAPGAGGAPGPAAPVAGRGAGATGASGTLVAPPVSSAPGDLVVVVGRSADAFAVAASMATVHGLRTADVDDRRSAILARATGVHESAAVVTALAWTSTAVDVLRDVRPDQVWVAVDVGRKHEDTVAWVDAVRAVVPVAAAVVVGAAETASPGTVHLLGLPVGRPLA